MDRAFSYTKGRRRASWGVAPHLLDLPARANGCDKDAPVTPPRGLLAFLAPRSVACVPPGNSTAYRCGLDRNARGPGDPGLQAVGEHHDGAVRETTSTARWRRGRNPAAPVQAAPDAKRARRKRRRASASSLGPRLGSGGDRRVAHRERPPVREQRAQPRRLASEDAPGERPDRVRRDQRQRTGDLKAEVWGDGRSAATGRSYTNATSYLTIFGGWHNTLHKIARLNEHGTDAKEIKVDEQDLGRPARAAGHGGAALPLQDRADRRQDREVVRQRARVPHVPGRAPLAGMGHDHFGFNDWEAKVCFDNVKVTPLP